MLRIPALEGQSWLYTTEANTVLEMRPQCESCECPLPPNEPGAMICSYECTFCAVCAERRLHGICPNCGGGLEPRPTRQPRS